MGTIPEPAGVMGVLGPAKGVEGAMLLKMFVFCKIEGGPPAGDMIPPPPPCTHDTVLSTLMRCSGA